MQPSSSSGHLPDLPPLRGSGNRPLVLASASPRRRALLATLALPFEIVIPDVDETPGAVEEARQVALRLATAKVAAVAAHRPDAWILGADTVVSLGGELFGKPETAAHAVCMLRRLRAREHEVITGVCLQMPTAKRFTAAAKTLVQMRDFNDDEIDAYVASGEASDKAAAYGIQSTSFGPVASIRGCFTNVVGLPLCVAAAFLQRAGIELPLPAPACPHHIVPASPALVYPRHGPA